MGEAESPNAESRNLASETERFLLDLSDQSTTGPVPLVDVLQNHVDGLLSIDPSQRPKIMRTRIDALNELIGGFLPGQMIIVAGPPSMGKTMFALDQAAFSVKSGYRSVYFSLDQTTTDLIERLIISKTRISRTRLYSGWLTNQEKETVCKAAVSITNDYGYSLHIDDTPRLTAPDIWSRCRKLKRQGGLDLVVVDYVQQVIPHRHIENRNLELTEISSMMKAVAKELSCVVLLLSQLNREWAQAKIEPSTRNWGFPQVSQLRESGALEADANMVLFPWVPVELLRRRYGGQSIEFQQYLSSNPDLEDASNGTSLAYIVVGKNKDGPVGEVECKRDRVRMQFYQSNPRPQELEEPF